MSDILTILQKKSPSSLRMRSRSPSIFQQTIPLPPSILSLTYGLRLRPAMRYPILIPRCRCALIIIQRQVSAQRREGKSAASAEFTHYPKLIIFWPVLRLDCTAWAQSCEQYIATRNLSPEQPVFRLVLDVTTRFFWVRKLDCVWY